MNMWHKNRAGEANFATGWANFARISAFATIPQILKETRETLGNPNRPCHIVLGLRRGEYPGDGLQCIGLVFARSLRSRQKSDEGWSHSQSTAVRVSKPTAGGGWVGRPPPQSPARDTSRQESGLLFGPLFVLLIYTNRRPTAVSLS